MKPEVQVAVILGAIAVSTVVSIKTIVDIRKAEKEQAKLLSSYHQNLNNLEAMKSKYGW